MCIRDSVKAREFEACAENIPLDIIYEDGDIIVVNKPKGMVVHPAHGNESVSYTHLGTTIIVRDLFYNTPARMNFLKKDATESANIVSLINKFAIGYPNISFKLINDNRMLLSTEMCIRDRRQYIHDGRQCI